MKATGLEGEYCQSCAALLDAHRREPQRVIVICGSCVGVFHQSGDYNRLDPYAVQLAQKKAPPAEETPEPKKPSVEPKKPAHKSMWRKR